MDGAELYGAVTSYIERLPEKQKADEKTREARLVVCRRCDSLVNGMCALCGCFVEVRAAKKAMHCAKDSSLW